LKTALFHSSNAGVQSTAVRWRLEKALFQLEVARRRWTKDLSHSSEVRFQWVADVRDSKTALSRLEDCRRRLKPCLFRLQADLGGMSEVGGRFNDVLFQLSETLFRSSLRPRPTKAGPCRLPVGLGVDRPDVADLAIDARTLRGIRARDAPERANSVRRRATDGGRFRAGRSVATGLAANTLRVAATRVSEVEERP
jgi:hypothetical protein